MKYLVTGATGFIGRQLVKELLEENTEVFVLTRNKKVCNRIFENKVKAISTLAEVSSTEKIDCIINLAGEPIANKRWSKAQKQKLLYSRLETTKNLIKLISKLEIKPECLISASAIGYYGSQGDQILDEDSNPAEEFTHQLCAAWEAEALQAKTHGVRVCITRLGVVLGKNGGALQKMLPAFNLGLGGKLGSGKQYFSWVSLDDATSAIRYLTKNQWCQGVYNLTSPNPVTNAEFTNSLGKALNRPTKLPMPTLVIKILLGEMGDRLLLNGQRVYPKNLLQSGFTFKFDNLNSALESIIK